MPFKDPQTVTLIETILFGLFAGIGGFLAYILRVLNDEGTPKWFRSVIEGCASAFVGVLAMLACKALGLDWRWSGVIVGVFGWLGAEASIAMLAKLIHSKLGIGSNVPKDPKS